MAAIDAEIVIFEGVDELDAIGPYEVFRNGARAGAAIETRLVTLGPTEPAGPEPVEPVAPERTDLVTASHGLRIEPDDVLGEPDLLVVPGGGWTTEDSGVSRAIADGRLPEAVARQSEAGATIASVCTGAMVLAAAGVLDGRPATTHAVARDALAERADVRTDRVVDDGDVLTAGGVTAGIDLALWLLEREFGPDVSGAVSAEMEHERRGEVAR